MVWQQFIDSEHRTQGAEQSINHRAASNKRRRRRRRKGAPARLPVCVCVCHMELGIRTVRASFRPVVCVSGWTARLEADRLRAKAKVVTGATKVVVIGSNKSPQRRRSNQPPAESIIFPASSMRSLAVVYFLFLGCHLHLCYPTSGLVVEQIYKQISQQLTWPIFQSIKSAN